MQLQRISNYGNMQSISVINFGVVLSHPIKFSAIFLAATEILFPIDCYAVSSRNFILIRRTDNDCIAYAFGFINWIYNDLLALILRTPLLTGFHWSICTLQWYLDNSTHHGKRTHKNLCGNLGP